MSMRPTILALAAAVGTVAALSPVARVDPLTKADQSAIRAVDSAYVTSWLRDDTAGVLATLAPDAVLMPAGQRPLTTFAAIGSFWWPHDGSRTRVLVFRRWIEEIGGSHDIAFMRGRDSLVFTYAKGGQSSRQVLISMTLAVMQRQPTGSWRIARMMWGQER